MRALWSGPPPTILVEVLYLLYKQQIEIATTRPVIQCHKAAMPLAQCFLVLSDAS